MKRPTLDPRVIARRHRVGKKRLIVLHHGDSAATMGEREWAALRGADGTRDVAGIVAACAAEGRSLRDDHVAEFLAELERAGLLREGIVGPPREAAPRPDRPVKALEGFRLRCDGSGTCCRIYPTTAFSALEVARAQTLAPEHDPDATFTPEHGSTLHPWLARAVAMVDGRCSFLADDGACALHRAGGAAGKPSGCRMYPAVFVDDGESVRATAAPECRCVFASARDGASKLEAHAQELDAAAHIEVLPEELPVTRDRLVTRERANSISDEVYRAASEEDAVSLLATLGDELDDGSVEGELAAMARRLERFNEQNDWRSESDFARAVPRWMRAAIDVDRATIDAEGESFYVRAVSFGRLWFRDGTPPLAAASRRCAARLWVARRLRAVIDPDEPLARDRALDEPIALVEAVCRSFGL